MPRTSVCVFGCCASGLPIHSLPKDAATRQKWLAFLQPLGFQLVNDRAGVCQRHFLQSDYLVTYEACSITLVPKYTRRLQRYAVPSVGIFPESNSSVPESRVRKQVDKSSQTYFCSTDKTTQTVDVKRKTCDRGVLAKCPNMKTQHTQVNFNIRHCPLVIPPIAHDRVPDLFHIILNVMGKYDDLSATVRTTNHLFATQLEIFRIDWIDTPVIGQMPAKILVTSAGEAHLIVLFGSTTAVPIVMNETVSVPDVTELLEKISKFGNYIWCSGLPLNVSSTTGKYTEHSYPCRDIRSKKCKGLFLRCSKSSAAVQEGVGICPACRIEITNYNRRNITWSSPAKRRHVQPSSHCNWRFLSPSLRKQRLAACATRHAASIKKKYKMQRQLELQHQQSFQ